MVLVGRVLGHGNPTPCFFLCLASRADSTSQSSAPAPQEIRSETLQKGHVLTRKKIRATLNIRPTVQKTTLRSTRWLWVSSHREGFSPHKDRYHGVRKESCHSQQGFQSGKPSLSITQEQLWTAAYVTGSVPPSQEEDVEPFGVCRTMSHGQI